MSGLDCLPAGTNPPNPAELLGSEKMAELLQTLSQRYDQIIIDAPPVLAVTDAPLLTAICDLVLVVLEAGRVPAKAAGRMQEMLATVHARVAGVVVNDKSGRGESYGYGYGYGYRYGHGYGYYSDEEIPPKRSWWGRFSGIKKVLRK
jgi:tyrosine-protein kinase Etk/Wzc